MKTHPVEYRQRILALTDDGLTSAEVAAVLGVSTAWVRSIKRRHAAGLSLVPKSRANRRTSLAGREGDRIRARVAEHPGTTLGGPPPRPELGRLDRQRLERRAAARADAQKKTLRAAERARPDVAVQRAAWDVVRTGLDPRRLVFLDETFGTTAMTRLYGWGPAGSRVADAVPHGHWKTTTFVVALRLGGLFAPLVIDGALTGELFVEYVRQELAPRLRPGDVLVMDNLPTHKAAGVAAAVAARDATRAVPAAVQPGPQPDRVGVREGQERTPPPTAANRRRVVGRLRGIPRLGQPRRGAPLLPTRRLRDRMIVKML